MPEIPDRGTETSGWPAMARTALRVAFGIIWIVNAAFTWTDEFANHYVGYLHNAAQGQPAWSGWWFNMWIDLVTPQAGLFIWLTRIIETLLAAALVLGFARKSLYLAGALFSLLIWSTAEGFGGPYAIGAANMGAGIIYVLVFIAMMAINSRVDSSPYSLDFYIEKRWAGWRRIAEWHHRAPRQLPRPVSWQVQGPILLGIAVLVFFLLAGLHSTLNVKAPTPAAAAAAVSPLQLASSKPIAKAYDAKLPPLTPGPEVNVNFTVTDDKIEIASGVYYAAWTYNGTVPGPIIHVRQGQTVNVTLVNHGTMDHSIDFHAAQIAPNRAFVDIPPGKAIHFSFVADVVGAFVYHCETMPILLHVGNGMYGALIVSPKDSTLPPAENSYVLVQSEWYTRQISGNLMGPDYQKMLNKKPDEVVFNGAASQYVAHPLKATVGKRVRLYVVDAGPNLWSSFHMIGSMFAKVYEGGNPAQALDDVSTFTLGPGQGAIFDLIFKEPGKYSFVDHDMVSIMLGAHGVIDVRGPNGEGAAKPDITEAPSAAATGIASAPKRAAEPTGPYAFDPAKGKALFASHCSVCHQSTGLGMPGTFPPLKGNSAVLNADPTKQISVILHGLHGQTIDGVTYAVAMPAFGSTLTDSEIANIVNHERSSWGNNSKQVTADTVKAVRAKQGAGH